MKAWELEKCIDEFGTEIYRFCMKLCMDKANAEDLYQQTFLKALESDMELDWEQNPKALFFSFAYNLWKSEQRKMPVALLLSLVSTLMKQMKTHCLQRKISKKTYSGRN